MNKKKLEELTERRMLLEKSFGFTLADLQSGRVPLVFGDPNQVALLDAADEEEAARAKIEKRRV